MPLAELSTNDHLRTVVDEMLADLLADSTAVFSRGGIVVSLHSQSCQQLGQTICRAGEICQHAAQ